MIYKHEFKEEILISKKFDKINKSSKNRIFKKVFGKKNPNKKFLVIKRSPSGGFFSNFIYVLKQMQYAYNNNYIPFVDMENFPTNYNQKKNIKNLKNIWELYFDQVSNYKIKEIYNSKNVYFSKTKINVGLDDYKNQSLKKIYKDKIKIKKNILNEANKFFKKNLKNYYTVGIHFRGTDQKISPGHALPPTIYDMKILIDRLIKRKKNFKIFLVTEQLDYYKKLLSDYKKYICFYDSFRTNKISDFNSNKRSNHRNRLGIESLVEGIILSKCRQLVYCDSNIPLFSLFISNNKITKYRFNYGLKSKRIFIANIQWYLTVVPISYIKFLIYKIFG